MARGSEQSIVAPAEGPPCPVCGKRAELTERGVVRAEWREKWCHRDRNGNPCPGVISMPRIDA
jgi:hypothetical protein